MRRAKGDYMILQVPVARYIPTNAYFYIDEDTKHGFLIDPGAEPDKLLEIVKERGFQLEKILLTHGHFDHIGAVNDLQRILKIPVLMQKNGRDYAENPVWNLSAQTGVPITLDDVTYLEDNTDIVLQANPDFRLHMIPVPGHTTDGCMYYNLRDHVAFVGDSIFAGSYGRTDMPGGDTETLMKSIVREILSLPDSTALLSGHSGATTVATEKVQSWYQGISAE